MNFDHMPELHWQLGYPFAIALMMCTASRSTYCSSAAAGSSPLSARPAGPGRSHEETLMRFTVS